MSASDLFKTLFGLHVADPTPEPRKRTGIFDSPYTPRTHARNLDARDVEQGGTIELDRPVFETASGESFGADEALQSYGMDSTTFKSAFSVSQGNIPEDLFNWYSQQGFIGFQAMAVVSQHWLVNKALRIPAIDAIRNGFEIASVGEEPLDVAFIAKLKRLDKKYKLKQNLVEFETNKRRFGYRIALFNVESDDEKYYELPFNIDGVKPGSYRGITQVDPSWVAPILDAQAAANPSAMDFYEPTWWMISGQKYHRSHLVVVRYIEPPDILKPTYQYGGISLTQMILERVYAAERVANEAPMLAQTKRLNVLYADIEAIIARGDAFEEKLAQLISFRDNYGVYVAGIEDRVEQHDTSLADLDDVIMNQYQLVAAVSEVPATKLLGTSPKGFSSTGEFEERSYHELLENIQEDMELLVNRHHEIAIRSDMGGKKGVEQDIEIVWNSVSTLTAKETEEINLIKAQTYQAIQMTGAIDGSEVRDQIIADSKSGFNGLESFEDIDDEDDFEDSGSGNYEIDPSSRGDSEAKELDETGTIQEISLNGAQVTSLVEIVTSVSTGAMPKSTAREIMLVSFPIAEAEADKILADIKEGSVKPEEPKAFGGGANPPDSDAAPKPGETTAQDDGVLGYVSVQPTLADALRLDIWRAKAGIEGGAVPTDLHITLAHDSSGIADYVPSIATYTIRYTGVAAILGNALVLYVESPALRARFEELKDMGATWDYDEYNPHITIKYQPDDFDFYKAVAALKVSPLESFTTGAEIRKVT